jgi:hypothetical protein
VVTLCTEFNIQKFYILPTYVYFCDFYKSKNKPSLLPYTASTACFYNGVGVFTARYELYL